MNKIIKITEEYNLEYYLKCLITLNKGNNNQYHNFEHTLSVVKNIYNIGKSENINDKKLRLLLIAGIFHDFNHLGGNQSSDIENIILTIDSFEDFSIEKEKDNEFIISLIECTEFPYKKYEVLSKYQKIIRDADMLQFLEDNFTQHILIGLNYEMNGTYKITEKQLLGQIGFMKNTIFFTDYAKEQVKLKLQDKINYCEFLIKILKDEN